MDSGEGLQISQDLRFQRKDWRVQRAGRKLLLLIVLAALVGLLGQGPVSGAVLQSPDGRVRIEYQRLARHAAPTTLKLFIRPGRDKQLLLSIDRQYVQDMQIENIIPTPARVYSAGALLNFVFEIPDPAQAAVILFWIEPQAYFLKRGTLSYGDGPPLHFTQFLFP